MKTQGMTLAQRLGLALLLAGASAGGVLAASSLGSRGALNPGQQIESGQSRLVMQGDCNLVLYRGAQAVWNSVTDGRGAGCRAVMQEDGNLVVVNGSGQPLWNSGTNGNPGAQLVLQQDGNLVVARGQQVVWSSSTGTRVAQQGRPGQGQGGFGGQGGYNNQNNGYGNQGGQGVGNGGGWRQGQGYGQARSRRAPDDMIPGDWLDGRRDDKLASRNRQFELRMQRDCNLVLYARDQPVWESRTDRRGRDCRAYFQNDGQLVIEADGQVIWSNRARARSGQPDLRIQDDGNLVAYDNNRPYWATNTDQTRYGQGGFGGGYGYSNRPR